MSKVLRKGTHHNVVAGPPLLGLLDNGVGDGDGGIAGKGGSGKQRQPGEEQLLRVGDVVVDGPLHKVAGGIGGGQRLASRACGGGFCDISIRIRGGNAADGEGEQEEDEQKDGIAVLQDS